MTASGQPAIATFALTKHFGAKVALSDLSITVAPGEVLGCLGPNGAGKTTAIRLLLGLLHPTEGRAEVFGFDCHRQTVEAHGLLAYVPGDATLWPGLTGAETLHLLGEVQGRVDGHYRDELIERFALDPSVKVRAYSKGNRQKILLIAGLMSRAPLLLLDEPSTGLDPLMEQTFRECLGEAKGRGQTVFLSSHILSEVEATCDRVAILRAGRLVETGTLSEMRHLSSVHVHLSFDGPAPDLGTVPGVTISRIDPGSIDCQVVGPMATLIEALAGTDVREFVSKEASLEELFLAHYGSGSAGGD